MNKLYKLYHKILEVFEDKTFDTKYFIAEQVDKVRYWWKTCVVGGIALILLLWVFTGWVALEKENIKVNKTGNKIQSTSSPTVKANDRFFVYTDSITYKIENNWFYLRTRASDDYGKLTDGSCYTIWSLGIRNGVFDMYENIIYSKEINCDER